MEKLAERYVSLVQIFMVAWYVCMWCFHSSHLFSFDSYCRHSKIHLHLLHDDSSSHCIDDKNLQLCCNLPSFKQLLYSLRHLQHSLHYTTLFSLWNLPRPALVAVTFADTHRLFCSHMIDSGLDLAQIFSHLVLLWV